MSNNPRYDKARLTPEQVALADALRGHNGWSRGMHEAIAKEQAKLLTEDGWYLQRIPHEAWLAAQGVNPDTGES